jgi:SAM-dependent methyltransferase
MQHDLVKDYYGRVLETTADLATTACCTADALPAHLRPLVARVHPEVTAKYYGCGLVAPTCLDGLRVLDLGSGSGRDAYVLAQLVGERGEVVGVDMTDEQLAVARAHVDWHAAAFGHAKPNVRFLQGYIERLGDLGLEPSSFDVVVSNCVINLSLDKPAVLDAVYGLLKPGGELYFSDVYADRRIPAHLAQDPVLYGECLSGALYWNDFLSMAKSVGFLDPRLVTSRPIEITDPAIAAKLGEVRFFSATYRLFKLPNLESACEDYGQAVVYQGTIPEAPDAFDLDGHHRIARGTPFPVCGNTWHMLASTRFAPHFAFIGDFSTHRGIFPGCGTAIPFPSAATGSAPATTARSCC